MTAAELAERLQARRVGQEWRALCPAHDDRSPSLDFRDGDKGLVLTCRSGCRSADVLVALRARGVLPSATTQAETVWQIRDSSGAVVAEHVLRGRDAAGKKLMGWRRGGAWGLGGLKVAELPLYGSERLAGAVGPVVVTEGERAADAARALGLVALGTVTGAASCPGAKALEVLRGREVLLWADNDPEGHKHMARVAAALVGIAASVAWVESKGAPAKGDAADFAAGGGTADEVLAMVAANLPPSGGMSAVSSGAAVRLSDAVPSALEDLAKFASGDFSDYASTGMKSLDRKLGGGLRKGQVTLLGAPTGGAKSTVLQIVAMTTALHGGVALLVSPEMGAHELAEREILRRSASAKWRRSPWRSLAEETRRGAAREHEAAAEKIAQEAAPFYILDRPSINMAEVEEEADALRRGPGLALIALDYAQEIASYDERTPRYLAVGAVAQRSVALAREFGVPVLIASQVNVVKEGTKNTYAFRESQILEHKAHNVLLFLVQWRETPDGRRTVESAAFRATKNRSGPLFELPVEYEPELFSIRDQGEREAPTARLPYAADRDDDDLAAAAVWEARRA